MCYWKVEMPDKYLAGFNCSFLTSLYCVERGNTHQGLSEIQDLHQGVLLSARHTLPDRGKTTMEKLRENVIC